MSITDRLSSRHRVIRSVDAVASVEIRAQCPDCHEQPRFYSERLFGGSRQICNCGDVPMKGHKDIPVHIPESMKKDDHPGQEAHAYHRCEICEAMHRVQKAKPSRVCGSKCLRLLQKQEGTIPQHRKASGAA